MNKIWAILKSMGVEDVYDEHPILLKNKVVIRCSCGKEVVVTADSVYRQHRRGNTKYLCKSCAGKKGWTPSKREIARNRTLRFWEQPEYAGEITGKAIAREIIKEVSEEVS